MTERNNIYTKEYPANQFRIGLLAGHLRMGLAVAISCMCTGFSYAACQPMTDSVELKNEITENNIVTYQELPFRDLGGKKGKAIFRAYSGAENELFDIVVLKGNGKSFRVKPPQDKLFLNYEHAKAVSI